jgi:hypothetical protein
VAQRSADLALRYVVVYKGDSCQSAARALRAAAAGSIPTNNSRHPGAGTCMSTTDQSAFVHQSHSFAAFARSTTQAIAGPMRWTLVLLLALGLASCERVGAPVAESQYSSMLVGDWQGTVGDEAETISYRADGGFSARVLPTGFISSTLGQGVSGTINGTWALQGRVITLTITSAENEQLQNTSTTSTIMQFSANELLVESASGETSSFVRAH